jgi:serine protease Do
MMVRTLRALVLAAILLAETACQPRAAPPPQLDWNQIYELARLGTVMVQADFKVQVSVPIGTIPPEKAQLLRQQLQAMIVQGQIPATQSAEVQALVKLILADPLAYVQPSDQVKTKDVEMVAIGSGFIVTPDGYIVTNAHVVAPPDADFKQGIVQTALQSFVKDFAQADAQGLTQLLGGTPSQEMLQQLEKGEAAYILKYMQLSQPQKSFLVEMGAAIPGVVVTQEATPADVVTVGAPIPGKDVAILKVEGKSDLPTLPLGDDATLKETDPLLIVGYPGDATFHPVLSQASRVEPTVTRGVLSRRAQMAGGWTALQTDATITHGNSGGPALDSTGRVIGLATFGTVNPQTGQEEAGENFLVPISIVKEFLQQVNVQPRESTVSQLYTQALVAYGEHHYRDAQQLFQQVNTLFPGNPWVSHYLSATQQAILAGQDESSPSGTTIAVAVGAAVGVLAIVGAVAWLLIRRRRGSRVLKGTRFCAHCGARLAPDQKFCGNCGAVAEIAQPTCPTCGTVLTGTERFCSHCGTPVKAGDSPTPPS